MFEIFKVLYLLQLVMVVDVFYKKAKYHLHVQYLQNWSNACNVLYYLIMTLSDCMLHFGYGRVDTKLKLS